MNKKGSAQDILLLAAVLIVLSICGLIGFKIMDMFNTSAQSSDVFEVEGKAASAKINSMFPGVIDNSFLFVAVGLGIAAFMMAAMVRVHPVFLVFYIFILVVIIIMSAIFSNSYQAIAATPELSSLADQMIITSTVMQILPFIVGIFGTILAIIMYKSGQGAY